MPLVPIHDRVTLAHLAQGPHADINLYAPALVVPTRAEFDLPALRRELVHRRLRSPPKAKLPRP